MDTRSNTIARFNILTDALQGDKNTPQSLLVACGSQGELAKYSLSSAHIEPMSLNTLKSAADKFIEDGGWAKLDSMRKSYLNASTHGCHEPIKKINKSIAQKEQLFELQNKLETERRFRIRIQVAYEALLVKLRSISENDPELRHFINGHVVGFSFKRITLANSE